VLTAYSWPGNVRELRNTVERMVVMGRGSSLTLGDVPQEVRAGVADALDKPRAAETGESSGDSGAHAGSLDLAAQEKTLILKALAECGDNRSLAARKLGIGRRTLYRKLAEYEAAEKV
jgi:DNA-binding NtrC family response regulator